VNLQVLRISIYFCSVTDLQCDFIAGLTVAMTVIPQGLAYATLAGLPPQVSNLHVVVTVILHGLAYSLLPPQVSNLHVVVTVILHGLTLQKYIEILRTCRFTYLVQ
jgi:MFS superfamily sulfate permease-like transporter